MRRDGREEKGRRNFRGFNDRITFWGNKFLLIVGGILFILCLLLSLFAFRLIPASQTGIQPDLPFQPFIQNLAKA